jgi:hypothetical protein
MLASRDGPLHGCSCMSLRISLPCPLIPGICDLFTSYQRDVIVTALGTNLVWNFLFVTSRQQYTCHRKWIVRLHAESLNGPTVFWLEDVTAKDACWVDQVIGLQPAGLALGHTVVIIYWFCIVASYHIRLTQISYAVNRTLSINNSSDIYVPGCMLLFITTYLGSKGQTQTLIRLHFVNYTISQYSETNVTHLLLNFIEN